MQTDHDPLVFQDAIECIQDCQITGSRFGYKWFVAITLGLNETAELSYKRWIKEDEQEIQAIVGE